MASLLAVCILGIAPVANDASAGKLKRGESARNFTLEMQRRGRGLRIPLPMGPSYIYYDYPYYYSRGHYPTHIGGPGYVYYGFPYSYRSSSRYGGRCAYWPATSVRRAWVDARRCAGQGY